MDKKNPIKYGIFAVIGIIVVVLFFQSCPKNDPILPESERIKNVTIVEKEYTPPIIHIPFTKDKIPIKRDKLPIPAKDVATSVEISTPKNDKPIIIVIDKKGEIHPIDAPEGTVIKIIKWHAPIIEISHHFSLSIIRCEKSALVLSYDPIRIWRFRIGLDGGVYTDWKSAFSGISVKFHALTIYPTNVKIHGIVGYELLKRRIYVGGTMSL